MCVYTWRCFWPSLWAAPLIILTSCVNSTRNALNPFQTVRISGWKTLRVNMPNVCISVCNVCFCVFPLTLPFFCSPMSEGMAPRKSTKFNGCGQTKSRLNGICENVKQKWKWNSIRNVTIPYREMTLSKLMSKQALSSNENSILLSRQRFQEMMEILYTLVKNLKRYFVVFNGGPLPGRLGRGADRREVQGHPT